MDGDFHKLRGSEQLRYTIYYHCASQFGWDKAKVDSQPLDYLKKLFATHIASVEDSAKSDSMPPMTRGMSKNFK